MAVTWLCGSSGAGKTTFAEKFKGQKNTIIIDADAVRNTINSDLGFTPEDRMKNNLRIAQMARLLSDQGMHVIVAVIAPYKKARAEIKKICNPLFIRVDHKGSKGREDDVKFEELPNPLTFNIQL